MGFEQEVYEVCGVRPSSWGFVTWKSTNSPVQLYFDHSHDSRVGQPLHFGVLEALDREYNITTVESVSSGKTGSSLRVVISDP